MISLKLFAIRAIDYYQMNLSQKKGFSCAYAAYHNEISCSTYGKQQIAQYGLFFGCINVLIRLKECRLASERLKQRGGELQEKAEGSLHKSKQECQNMDTCEKLWFAEAAGEVACCAFFIFS